MGRPKRTARAPSGQGDVFAGKLNVSLPVLRIELTDLGKSLSRRQLAIDQNDEPILGSDLVEILFQYRRQKALQGTLIREGRRSRSETADEIEDLRLDPSRTTNLKDSSRFSKSSGLGWRLPGDQQDADEGPERDQAQSDLYGSAHHTSLSNPSACFRIVDSALDAKLPE